VISGVPFTSERGWSGVRSFGVSSAQEGSWLAQMVKFRSMVTNADKVLSDLADRHEGPDCYSRCAGTPG